MPEDKRGEIEPSIVKYEDLDPGVVSKFLPGWSFEETHRKVGSVELHTGWSFRRDVQGTSYELRFENAIDKTSQVVLTSAKDGEQISSASIKNIKSVEATPHGELHFKDNYSNTYEHFRILPDGTQVFNYSNGEVRFSLPKSE